MPQRRTRRGKKSSRKSKIPPLPTCHEFMQWYPATLQRGASEDGKGTVTVEWAAIQIALKKQLGVASNTIILTRITSMSVWKYVNFADKTTYAHDNSISMAFHSLAGNFAATEYNSRSFRSKREAFGSPTSPAYVSYRWPKVDSSVIITSEQDTSTKLRLYTYVHNGGLAEYLFRYRLLFAFSTASSFSHPTSVVSAFSADVSPEEEIDTLTSVDEIVPHGNDTHIDEDQSSLPDSFPTCQFK